MPARNLIRPSRRADPLSRQEMPISWGRRIDELAAEHPDKVAIVFAPRSGPPELEISWAEVDRASNRFARMLAAAGANSASLIGVALPNQPEHLMLAIACWKIGGCVLPLDPALPANERSALLDVADPDVLVADWPDLTRPGTIQASELTHLAARYADGPLEDRISTPGKAICSGGSTGQPKVIVDPRPWTRVPGRAYGAIGDTTGWRVGMTQVVTTRLYHNLPFILSHFGLFDDHTIVLMEHFDASYAVDLIKRWQASYLALVPVIMQRIARLPSVRPADLASVETVYHSGAPCPPWVKRFWLDLVGPERVWEGFGATESVGAALIRGDDWLRHPDTVGRPHDSEIKIFDDAGHEVPPGTIGNIYGRRLAPGPTYRYIGASPLPTTPDGFATVGDLGWLDDEGYLHPADRRVDLIVSGGANIHPAEVEAVLSEHSDVADVVVVPVPDEEWGKRVHAVVVARDPDDPPAISDLDQHCRAALSAYKCPKTYEFITGLPRELTGKLRRSALAEERASGWTGGMIPVKVTQESRR